MTLDRRKVLIYLRPDISASERFADAKIEAHHRGDRGDMSRTALLAGLALGEVDSRLPSMLAALLACGLPAYEAAACAVYLHGAAADRAAAKRGEYGMLPHDILPELGALFAENQR